MDLKSLMPFGRRDMAAGEDPFTAMRREMDRLFNDMARQAGLPRSMWGEAGASPRIDVKETAQAIEVHAELPGVNEKDVELQLADHVLTIKGEKRQEKEEKDKGYHLMERSFGSFMRRIPLPVEVDEDKVEARFEKGVLTVTLARSAKAEAKTRKIEIRGG